MEHLYEKALESAEYIKTHTKKRPKIAVVLGSGLGKLTADFTDTEELSYKDIPNFPVSTVAGHKGALLAGKLGDTEVYAMEGRFHFYEGYSMKEVCVQAVGRGKGGVDQRLRRHQPGVCAGHPDAHYRLHQHDGHEPPHWPQR